MKLRHYQQGMVTGARDAYRAGFRAPLLVAPCGSGKTVVFTHIAQGAAARNKRVLIAAHRHELVEQISDALTQWDVPHGLIMPGQRQGFEQVKVASVQTLVRRQRNDRLRALKHDLVVMDEAHHVTRGSAWGQVIDYNDRAKLLGVTATPRRLDGRGLGAHAGGYFDRLIFGPTTMDLIEQGYLCPPVVYRPPVDQAVDVSNIPIRRGDFVTSELSEVMDRAKLTGNAITHYRKYVDRKPSIAFCVDIKHAEHVREQFSAAGYQAAVLTGKTPRAERTRMIDDLRNGALHVLTSVNTISEGTDIPVCAAAIMLRPTASLVLATQQMGRALRPYPGKTRAVILDHAGNTLNHPLPTEEIEWSLDGRARKPSGKAESPNRQCPECYAVFPARVRVCAECGHEWPVSEREIETDDSAELEEVDAVAVARERRKQQGMAESIESLIALGKQRGYKNPRGWAYHVMRARRNGGGKRLKKRSNAEAVQG